MARRLSLLKPPGASPPPLVGNNAEPLMLLWRQQGFSVVADELPAFLNPPPLPGPGVKWGTWVAPD